MVATSMPAGRAAVSVMALMHAEQGQQEALNTLSLENRSDHDVCGWEHVCSPPLLEA